MADKPAEADPDHQRFLDECASRCRCLYRLCDGVLAGGLCDGFDEDYYEQHRRDDLDNFAHNDFDYDN